MKFILDEIDEIEIDDDIINAMVLTQSKVMIKKAMSDHDVVNLAIKQAVIDYVKSDHFLTQVQRAAGPSITYETQRVIPGWIKSKIREMLKAADIMKKVK